MITQCVTWSRRAPAAGRAWRPWSLRRGWGAESPPWAPRWTRGRAEASWDQSYRWDPRAT